MSNSFGVFLMIFVAIVWSFPESSGRTVARFFLAFEHHIETHEIRGRRAVEKNDK